MIESAGSTGWMIQYPADRTAGQLLQTFRLLEGHRKVAACNSCHRKIDPKGFAMERFDPIGRF